MVIHDSKDFLTTRIARQTAPNPRSMKQDTRAILQQRLIKPPGHWIDVRSNLRHFALINYALPKNRLEPYIPARFTIPEFEINGRFQAMMSAVPFYDEDFRFVYLAPWLKFGFGQTNFRVYVIDQQTGEHGVWFFGTTLGSRLVYAAQLLWGIPWHFARYQIDCRYQPVLGRYERFSVQAACEWGSTVVEIEDTGQAVPLQAGFHAPDEMKLILTHPIDGYYYRRNGRLGSYTIWHAEIPITLGKPKQLYFSLYERLGLLSREEMQQPHSIFICPAIEFDVYLPPKKLE